MLRVEGIETEVVLLLLCVVVLDDELEVVDVLLDAEREVEDVVCLLGEEVLLCVDVDVVV